MAWLKDIVLFLTLGIAAWGQRSAELSAKYRQVTSYELRPTVVMTRKYAADGQACDETTALPDA